MVFSYLTGGLSNQLFQYALGRRLSLDRNLPLKLDLAWFGKQTLRQYRLDQFKIQAEIALPTELEHFTLSNRRDLVARFFAVTSLACPTIAGRSSPSAGLALIQQSFKRRNRYIWQVIGKVSNISSQLRLLYAMTLSSNMASPQNFGPWLSKFWLALQSVCMAGSAVYRILEDRAEMHLLALSHKELNLADQAQVGRYYKLIERIK